MKRKAIGAFVVVVLLALPLVAQAAPPPTPPAEHASGKAQQGIARVFATAEGNLASGAAIGEFYNEWPQGLVYQVDVTCLLVVGNRASIGGVITASGVFPGHVGSGLVMVVEDNGATGAPDKLGHFLFDVPQPLPGETCPFPPTMSDDFAIDQGNFQVTGGTTAAAPDPSVTLATPVPVTSVGP